METEEEIDDKMKPTIVGHLIIIDKETGDVLINQRSDASQQIPLYNLISDEVVDADKR